MFCLYNLMLLWLMADIWTSTSHITSFNWTYFPSSGQKNFIFSSTSISSSCINPSLSAWDSAGRSSFSKENFDSSISYLLRVSQYTYISKTLIKPLMCERIPCIDFGDSIAVRVSWFGSWHAKSSRPSITKWCTACKCKAKKKRKKKKDYSVSSFIGNWAAK